MVLNLNDEEFMALATREEETPGRRLSFTCFFAASYSDVSAEDACAKAVAALGADVADELAQKYAFFDALPAVPHVSEDEERAYYRAFSALKSQVYTPEGKYKRRYTTPDRLPHRRIWIWDSVFHSMGKPVYRSVARQRHAVGAVR